MSAADLHRLIDRLAERYSAAEYKLDAMRAREEYFERAGKVFDDDAELFEGRMASFLEWYVIERPFRDGAPPIERALRGEEAEPAGPAVAAAPADRTRLALVAASHRSLFESMAVGDGVVEIEDVIGGARFSVLERRSTIGFSVGDLFEARVMSDGEDVVFGKTFLFHPPDARDVILDWTESAVAKGTARDEILFHLSRHHIRWHRQGYLAAARIYGGDDQRWGPA